MNIPSFHHASPSPILEGCVFMLRFAPMEWWFWNARTGFWISLQQTQMQTLLRERIVNSKLGSCYEMTNLFQNNDKETFPLHFTPFAPQFPLKKNSLQHQNVGLPCRMRHIFRSLRSLKISSLIFPCFDLEHPNGWCGAMQGQTFSITTAKGMGFTFRW